MGELYLHNLDYYIQNYNCKTFVETGTGIGTGLTHALKSRFDKLYSIEIIDDLYNKCKQNFTDTRLKLIHNNSLKGLTEILEELDEAPCLFWLDAHFPGADFKYNSYEYLKDVEELHKPLKLELELILSKRKNKDVFILDDLQLYEDGPFELYNKEFVSKYGDLNSQFLTKMLSNAFSLRRDYRHQGFLIATPK